MLSQERKVDLQLLAFILILVTCGIFIFLSASIGLLATEGEEFRGVVGNQFLSLGLGLIALYLGSKIHYRFWKKYALPIFIFGLMLTGLVFVPDLGFSHGGARRWIDLGFITFQPAEILKLGFVFYFASWLSFAKERASSVKYGLIPFLVMFALIGALLLMQPDTGTFMVFSAVALAMYIGGGGSWKHVAGIMAALPVGILLLAWQRPYVMDRIKTFFDPEHDALGASYQLIQSLIAIGSGGIKGKGFGESLQKFGHLPEPVGDSVFAVFAEEFGLIGGLMLILLFLLFAKRAFFVAENAPNMFSRLVVLGIAIIIVGQAFVNMGAMLGVIPLTGVPLPFVSHGGTALIMTLFEAGILLGVSRFAKQ